MREFGGKSKNKGHRRRFQRSAPRRSMGKIELAGLFRSAGRKGGFVEPTDGREIRIDPGFMGDALHGDKVRILLHKDKVTGEIVKVLERARSRFVGVIEGRKFTPDDKRVNLEVAVTDAIENEKVLIEITDWHRTPLTARVVEKLGKPGTHETEMRSIMAGNGIVYDFPEDVEAEASMLKQNWPLNLAHEAKVRRDFRETPTITIDPATAKDFDDALSFKDLGGGKFEIGVHIADVSHFVRPGTTLDREAARRANSVYLVDRTVPMLPEILSADLCSLVPNQDRLTYSAVFTMDERGKVLDEWFGKSVIHSQKRFTYTEAAEVLVNKKGAFLRELSVLNSISKVLREERIKSGSVIFEKDEIRIELATDGKPVRIYVKERLPTHSLIEEFMLLANKHVARFLSRAAGTRNGAALYRIHDLPDKDRLENVLTFLKSMGYRVALPKRLGAKEIHEIFDHIKGADIENLVQTAILRSMAKAIYSTRNIGHFGLGFEHYTHFTSPIRRYPDLIVHRMLSKYLKRESIPQNDLLTYERAARYSSEKEREAEQAERESIKFKQAEYMLSRVGQTFSGVIAGVTEWGLFVEERETRAEGLLRISTLGEDYFEFDEKKFALIGRKTKKVFRLGDKIKVKLAEVDLSRHQLTWELT